MGGSMSLFLPTSLVVRYIGFSTASSVSLSATSSPGTTIVSLPITVSLNTLDVIAVASVGLYNSGTSDVNETLQVFVDSNYVSVGITTVPAGSYAQATVNYVFSNLAPGGHTIGLAAYGGSLTAQYAEITALVIGYP
jgi:hypothetical protein